jgi:acyl-CoA thioester hydrolase
VSIREPHRDDRDAAAWPERVTRDGNRVRTAFRVRYAETDRMGVAYYANYLVWFEVMRGDFMRAIGLPYTDFEARGIFLPIAEAHVRYARPVRYDDVVEVEAWLTAVRSRSVTFQYRVESSEQLVATGWTTHIPVDEEGRPARFPRELLDPLVGYQENDADL